MKKFIIISLIVLLCLGIVMAGTLSKDIKYSLTSLKKVGDKKDIAIEKGSTYKYNQVKEFNLVGFEPVYYSKNITTSYNETLNYNYTCNNVSFNISSNQTCNVSVQYDTNTTLKNRTELQSFLNKTAKGEPIYKQKVKKISYETNDWVFDTKQCWVCDEYIACLSKKDGGANVEDRAEEFKCDGKNYPIIRSGESGFIEKLKDKKELYLRSDVGEI